MNYFVLEELANRWKKKVCLFGLGLIGNTCGYDVIKEAGFCIDFYCDNNKGEQLVNEIPCISVEKLYSYKGDVLVFLTVGNGNQKRIKEQLNRNGIFNVLPMGFIEIQEVIESIIISKDSCKRKKYEKIIDDSSYLKRQFEYKFGYHLDVENPKTFNEKIQWLKLYDRQDIYTSMVDKSLVKQYVADKIGEAYIVPTIKEWENTDDILLDELPDKFVLKCTHDSGGLVLCKDKNELNFEEEIDKLKRSMKRNFYYVGREWPYKNVKPQIIAEEYLENDKEEGLHDYKVWCFNGNPKYVQYVTGRIGKNTYEGFYDTDWKLQEFTYHNPMILSDVPRPGCLDEILLLASILAKNLPFMRVDFYILPDNKIFFGEMTFYPMAGLEHFTPERIDYELGDYIKLPNKTY